MTLLSAIKVRCAIPNAVTVYDAEIMALIRDAIEDMKTAGVPESILPDPEGIADENAAEPNARVLTAIVLYVQGMRGSDRSDTNLYIRLYRNKLHKLMLEPEEDEDVDDVNIAPVSG